MLRSVSQLSFFGAEREIWPVARLTRYLRELLESDYRLQELWVAGEVSNLSRPASGHLYFTLKDSEASLRCVMWRSEVGRQVVLPRDGDAVEVHGHISVYDSGGVYQLYADRIRLAGAGDLFQAFQALKERLEAEGLFDPERKRPLPAWPRRIGIVTSPTGAALRDALHVLQRRFPLVEVVLAPTPVQGEGAPPGIIAALEALNRAPDIDLILLIRGGGSIEDLWAFNDEGVARAIAASALPVVAGVGHETDFTIADFAADVRAPTPSAAAEIATPDRAALREGLAAQQAQLVRSVSEALTERGWDLRQMARSLRLLSPRSRVANEHQRLDELVRRAGGALQHGLQMRRAAVAGRSATLRAVGPQAVLERGFAVVTRAEDGAVVRSAAAVQAGDQIDVRVADGEFAAEVLDAEEGQDG